jgi:pimeloyl-ACP methyl ester carboxylesterase
MREELEALNLFLKVPKIMVPVTFFLGIHDHQVPFEASVQYIDALEAPRKDIVWFHDSAHFPYLEEPDKFVNEVVRAFSE